MTENFYRTRNYKPDHSAFGGYIYLSDFETDYRGKNNNHGSIIAQRIASDLRFDEQCRRNIVSRTRKKVFVNA